MSYNRNLNNNYRGSNFTFRYVPDFPPPPLPPPVLPTLRPQFFPPQSVSEWTIEKDDQEFIKSFEKQIPKVAPKNKPKTLSITHVREEIQNLIGQLKDFEKQLNRLTENIEKLSEDEWKNSMQEMDDKKRNISNKLERCVGSYMDMSRKLLAKRTAKRLRLKRLKEERKAAKKEMKKVMEERSRKIDENLQKIKDDILAAEKAKEAKLEADVVLKEVRRRKQDAKKCLVKLDALLALRKARENTAKGRGEAVSERDAAAFINNVEKLKILWNKKLVIYEKGEIELNAKLTADEGITDTGLEGTLGVEAGLVKWREVLFGDNSATPQRDFHGDVHRFVAVRSEWDQYLHEKGTPLPVGWIIPPLER